MSLRRWSTFQLVIGINIYFKRMQCPHCSKICCVNGEKALQLHIQRVHSHGLQESHCRRELPVESWQTQPDFPEEQYNCNTDGRPNRQFK